MEAKLCRQAAEIINPNSGAWVVSHDTFIVRCIEWLEKRHGDFAMIKFSESGWEACWKWNCGFDKHILADDLPDTLAKAVIASGEEGQN